MHLLDDEHELVRTARGWRVARWPKLAAALAAMLPVPVIFVGLVLGIWWIGIVVHPEEGKFHQLILAMVLTPVELIACCGVAGFIYGRLRWRYVAYRPCASCSYDLAGNTSGICPECGNEIRSSG